MRLLRKLLFFLLLTSTVSLNAEDTKSLNVSDLVRTGSDQLLGGKLNVSVETFEKAISLEPKAKAYLWQLGIAYYYAGRFLEGRELFEAHQTVNSNDVENAVWHFLCVARGEGLEAARKNFIRISGDPRVPMKEVHQLFAGTGTEEAVVQAASAVSAESNKRNALFYTHLYLALYHEALGHLEKSREHIRRATTDFGQEHYMGKLAELHMRLRAKAPE